MRVNYTNLNGNWTRMTLSDDVVESWLMSQPVHVRNGPIARVVEELRGIIERTQDNAPPGRLVSRVEATLLAELRHYVTELEGRYTAATSE